ncbi:hypothetical protein JXM83_06140 [Candidatus Woesearchaeota archaeon]|nr:hypothetical protein [Candidatus Woesearchaeota archaeon]
MRRTKQKKVFEYKFYLLAFVVIIVAVFFLFRNQPVVDITVNVDCTGVDSTACAFRSLYFLKDKSVCSQISDEDLRGLCTGNLLEVNPCELLSLGGYSDAVFSQCLVNYSMSRKDSSLCIGLSNSYCIKVLYNEMDSFSCSGDFFCEMTLANASKDSSFCTNDYCLLVYAQTVGGISYCSDIADSEVRFNCIDGLISSGDDCMLIDDSLRVLNCFKDNNLTCEDSVDSDKCESFIKDTVAKDSYGLDDSSKFVMFLSVASVFNKNAVCASMLESSAKEICYATQYVKDPCDDSSFDVSSTKTYDYLCNAKYLNQGTLNDICADFEDNGVMTSTDCLTLVEMFQK